MMMIDDILGIIPARYASTRFPGKPLADIGGRPMIQRVYEQSCKALKHVYVATDDGRIRDAVMAFGGNAVMTSASHKSGTDRCAEALNIVEQATGRSFAAVINIQGDEPFIDPQQLLTVAQSFAGLFTDIVTLVKPLSKTSELFDANKPKVVVNTQHEALYFSRSPIPFLRNTPQSEWVNHHQYYGHIGLYGYRSSILREITLLSPSPLEMAESLEQLRWLENGYTVCVRETLHESTAIDTPADLEKVKQMGLF